MGINLQRNIMKDHYAAGRKKRYGVTKGDNLCPMFSQIKRKICLFPKIPLDTAVSDLLYVFEIHRFITAKRNQEFTYSRFHYLIKFLYQVDAVSLHTCETSGEKDTVYHILSTHIKNLILLKA